MRMMNTGTTSMDHILYMGTTSKTREGIGYQKGPLETNPIVQKKNSYLMFAKIEENNRTPQELEHHVGTIEISS